MLTQVNNLSLMIGGTGLLLSPVLVTIGMNSSWDGMIIGASHITGTILLIIGLCLYAVAKGRSPLWGLCGLLSVPGFLVLLFLGDHSFERVEPESDA